MGAESVRETLGQGYSAVFSCEPDDGGAPAGSERLARLLRCSLLLNDPSRVMSGREGAGGGERQAQWDRSSFACHRMREVRVQLSVCLAHMPACNGAGSGVRDPSACLVPSCTCTVDSLTRDPLLPPWPACPCPSLRHYLSAQHVDNALRLCMRCVHRCFACSPSLRLPGQSCAFVHLLVPTRSRGSTGTLCVEMLSRAAQISTAQSDPVVRLAVSPCLPRLASLCLPPGARQDGNQR